MEHVSNMPGILDHDINPKGYTDPDVSFIECNIIQIKVGFRGLHRGERKELSKESKSIEIHYSE